MLILGSYNLLIESKKFAWAKILWPETAFGTICLKRLIVFTPSSFPCCEILLSAPALNRHIHLLYGFEYVFFCFFFGRGTIPGIQAVELIFQFFWEGATADVHHFRHLFNIDHFPVAIGHAFFDGHFFRYPLKKVMNKLAYSFFTAISHFSRGDSSLNFIN